MIYFVSLNSYLLAILTLGIISVQTVNCKWRTQYSINNRPIVGILTQEYFRDNSSSIPDESYIAASYVKFIEGAGGRVVPILIGQNETYLRRMFESVNGVLFPGGTVYFSETVGKNGYVDAGILMYKWAEEAWKSGDYFPIWGTCLGFEFLIWLGAGQKDIMSHCESQNIIDSIKLSPEWSSSRLYGKAPKSIVNILSSRKVAANFHSNCITPKNFTKFGLNSTFQVLSTNYDSKAGLEFVSTIEAKDNLPFYGVQFHPEKNLYEWTTKRNIPHEEEALRAAQYMANFFVAETRKNSHKFNTEEEESSHLIYNYSPIFSGANGYNSSNFDQIYVFPISK